MTTMPIQDDDRDGETAPKRPRRVTQRQAKKEQRAAAGRNVSSWRETQLTELEEMARRQDKVLFDGEWLSPRGVRRHLWKLRLRGLRQVFEVLLLCVFLLVATGILWVLLMLLGGF
jgi:Flp pilus assembly protein TadB